MDTALRSLPGSFLKTLKVTAIMDKYILQKTLPGCGFVRMKTAVEETFNGWFLMNTPQVSTGGVYSCYMKDRIKNQSGCNKIAVHFFSLHKAILYANLSLIVYPQNICL